MDNNKRLLISVIIPAYNDEKTIAKLIIDSQKILKSLTKNFEIIVLDDCSKDSTFKRLLELKKTVKKLRTYHHKKNLGYGATLLDLIKYAKGSILINLAGDNQFPASNIKKLISKINNSDIVVGTRNKRKDNLYRRFISKIYNIIISLVAMKRFNDVNSIKAIKKSIFKNINIKSRSAFVDAEILIRAHRKGFRISETKILHLPRKFGFGIGGKLYTILPVIKDLIKFIFNLK